jgi:hypothetical protein
MECLECGKAIIGRRADSRYCSKTCSNRAKQRRSDVRLIERATQQNPVAPLGTPVIPDSHLYGFTEIRELEKDKFTTVLNLKETYEEKIKQLEKQSLKDEFEILRLRDKVTDLKEKHSEKIKDASTNTVKETVSAITQMPAIQSALGMLASNLIPDKSGALAGVENSFNVNEKQIIESIRRMQPEAQQYLIQMLFVLFAKPHDEQMEIFTSLVSFMQDPKPNEDDLP